MPTGSPTGERTFSETDEIHRALLNTRRLFPDRRLCFLGDAGLDDQKIFGWASKLEADFIIRVAHKPERPLWALVADDVSRNRQLILLTNVPILDKRSARTVYDAWRRCPHIEHTYRFDQERGLEVEDMQVHAVEHMRRLFTLVLIAALFVYYIANVWPEPAVRWLLDLGGKLHLKLDADGPYLLIAGIAAVFVTVATLSFATRFPFPRECLTCG